MVTDTLLMIGPQRDAVEHVLPLPYVGERLSAG
jgi:hypothetical protein